MARRAPVGPGIVILALVISFALTMAAIAFVGRQAASVRDDRAELQDWAVDQFALAQKEAALVFDCAKAARVELGIALSGVPVISAGVNKCRHVYAPEGVACIHRAGYFDQVEVELIPNN